MLAYWLFGNPLWRTLQPRPIIHVMEYMNILVNSPLFAGLSRNVLEEMASALVLESWPQDCQLLGPAMPADRFRVVVRGRVKITSSNGDNGRELTLWLLGPGEGFDVVSLLDGQPHTLCAWTLDDDVATLSAPTALFREWLERFPPFRGAFHRYIALKLRELTELASDLALHDTMTRLARLLLRHFDPAQRQLTGLNLIHDLPQEELASLIGSVRVVVSRLLAQLKREAVVELHQGALRVADLKRLLRHAQAQIARAVSKGRRGKAGRG
jgi:CRP/FNR family transcriptional regulator, cyclic AMP receptor protein